MFEISKDNTNPHIISHIDQTGREYFEIEYFDGKLNDACVGFGSYRREYCEQWLKEYFIEGGSVSMDAVAMNLVCEYINEHWDATTPKEDYTVFTVWKAKVLQNWKFLISSDLPDGMYYELTFNGDKNEWYLDAYKKFENRCIPNDTAKAMLANSL